MRPKTHEKTAFGAGRLKAVSTPTSARHASLTDATGPRGLHLVARHLPQPVAQVLCIHGALDRATSFNRLSRRLESFDVIAYDRRGYQRSRDVGPLSFEAHVDDAIAVAESLPRDTPLVVVGHSYGGTVAFALAAKRPDLVAGVMAYESPFPWVVPRELTPLTDDDAREVESFFRRVAGSATWDRLSEAERQSRRLDGPALVSDLLSLRTGEELLDVTAISCPAQYTYGTTTAYEYYRSLASALEQRNALITSRVMEGADHGAHLTHPGQLALFIRDFVEATCE